MEALQEELYRLITEACQHPSGSPTRQKKLTQIIRLVGPRLWKERTDYYEDALQQTWLFFARNLCNYDPAKASVVVWLNNHLKWRLHTFKCNEAARSVREVSIDALNDNPDYPKVEVVDPASVTTDDGESAWTKEFIAWLAADPTEVLRAAHMRNLPHINCQVLIQRRLFQEITWKDLSQEFSKPIPALASHFQRKCIPCLRKAWDDLRNNDN